MKAYTDNNGYLYIHCQGHIYEIYKGDCLVVMDKLIVDI